MSCKIKKLKNSKFSFSPYNFLLQSFLKEVELPLGMASSLEHCVIAVKCSTIIDIKDSIGAETTVTGEFESSIDKNLKNDKMYQLLVCNSIGTSVDCKKNKISSFSFFYF